jgi:hypothetical protein
VFLFFFFFFFFFFSCAFLVGRSGSYDKQPQQQDDLIDDEEVEEKERKKEKKKKEKEGEGGGSSSGSSVVCRGTVRKRPAVLEEEDKDHDEEADLASDRVERRNEMGSETGPGVFDILLLPLSTSESSSTMVSEGLISDSITTAAPGR